MKKLSVLLVLIAFSSCKEKIEKNTEIPQSEQATAVEKTPCLDSMDEYNALQTVEAKANWLQTHGANVCEDVLFDTVITEHKITTAVTGFTATHEEDWATIESLINGHTYDKYVSFDFNTRNADTIDSIKLVNNYVKGGYTYSPVLFRAIAMENKLNSTDVFKFGFHNLNGSNVIVIQAGNNFYDFSDKPGK